MTEYPENPYDAYNPEHKSQPPTDEELLKILANSRLPNNLKKQLAERYSQDPWIKRQLERIYFKIDQEGWKVVPLLWEALQDDWKNRRKNLPYLY